MKIIYNSFMGGLFRTLGKFIAFIVLFLIFGYIVSTNDLKISNLFGFGKVYAATGTYGSGQYMDCGYNVNSQGCFVNSNIQCSNWFNFGTEHTFGTTRFLNDVKAMVTSGSGTWTSDNVYTLTITEAWNPKNWTNISTGTEQRIRLEGCTSTSASSCSSSNVDTTFTNFIMKNVTNNNYWVQYEIKFLPSTNLKMIWFQFLYDNNIGYNSSCINPYQYANPQKGTNLVDFQIYRIDSLTYVSKSDMSAVTDSINQQTNIINNNFNQTNENINNIDNSINEIDDYLKDDSIDRNHISSGMSDIPRTNALTPFSSFINLPLNWIQNFLSSSNTCSNISIPIPFLDNKNLVLPCMSEFWSEMGVLGTLVELVWVAIVGSRIFNMFYKLAIEVIDPNPNSFNHLSKLKEWEL